MFLFAYQKLRKHNFSANNQTQMHDLKTSYSNYLGSKGLENANEWKTNKFRCKKSWKRTSDSGFGTGWSIPASTNEAWKHASTPCGYQCRRIGRIRWFPRLFGSVAEMRKLSEEWVKLFWRAKLFLKRKMYYRCEAIFIKS